MEGPRPTVRVALSIDARLLSWVEAHCQAGGPFRNATHAIESACRRLQDEQAFIQRHCNEHGLRFDATAFWNLFDDLRKQYAPNRRGPILRSEKRMDRLKIWFSVDAGLQRWMERQAKEGSFETASHLVETGFRHLQRIERPGGPALDTFPFDAVGTWASYKRKLAALDRRE